MCRHKMAGFVPEIVKSGIESRFLCPLACDNCWFGFGGDDYHMDVIRAVYYYSDKISVHLRLGRIKLPVLARKIQWALSISGLNY